ncbi:MAG: glutamate--tRNA ligase, partial [Gammaproteobacteria bacterium]
KRQDIYNKYYDELEKTQHVYPCFCSDQQLAISRKVQLAAGHPPRYAGTCRQLTPEQIAEKKSEGLQPTLRFKVPESEIIQFTDLVRGVQTFNSRDIGDFIIRRADGTASFFFCNAIDDAVMSVTHALRGDDHLTNTPRQLLILDALGLTPPQYGHIALIIGFDGSPLSKRHGSRSVKELREEGFLPLAIVNYLSRLGHYYAEPHFMEFDTLSAKFDPTALGSAPSRFDPTQLIHWQKEAIAHSTNEALWMWMGEEVHNHVPAQHRELFITIVRHNIVFPQDALHWVAILFSEKMTYTANAIEVIRVTGSEFFNMAVNFLPETGTDVRQLTQKLQEKFGLKGKALFQPLRAAIMGELSGPEMLPIVQLLGADTLRVRLQHAANL